MKSPFYSKSVLVRSPDMVYLNKALKDGRLVITYQGIIEQDFKTSDNVLFAKRDHAGKFLGGGIHEFSWTTVYKNGKEIFRSYFQDIVYRYFEEYLKRGDNL